ncbi:MAG: FAD-dependent oxidoreductase, partial [Deltaproteobacteria bacterium]|nr:FAD-dependent oxidoreductase [Deltaproteobacteria bacterium]
NDTGTHIIPGIIKKLFAKIGAAFVVRTGNINDVVAFVKWAKKNNETYTIRGAGTWPFGGAVPLNDDIILDLSYLGFHKLFCETDSLAFGAGFLFPDARDYLQEQGYTLKQEITNPNSGTLAGWIVTGGLGLGSYKYGPVRDSVQMLLVVNPQGELKTLKPGEDDFDLFFGSEGQAGVVVGGALSVRKESFVTKPYAFSFETTPNVTDYLQRLQQRQIKPTSVIYFDRKYISETWKIE